MHTVNMHEAKTQLSRLVDESLAGKEVIIARAGKPLVRLVPVVPLAGRRQGGCWANQVWMAPDFDETPPDVIDSFYDSRISPDDEAAP